MSDQDNTPAHQPIDHRYGHIVRLDEFLRGYLRGKCDIEPGMYYRIVGASGNEVVSGRELTILAQALVRDPLLTRVRRIAVLLFETVRTVCRGLFYGLVLYGRYCLPVTTTNTN